MLKGLKTQKKFVTLKAHYLQVLLKGFQMVLEYHRNINCYLLKVLAKHDKATDILKALLYLNVAIAYQRFQLFIFCQIFDLLLDLALKVF